MPPRVQLAYDQADQRRAAFAASGVIFGFMEAKTADVTDRP